MKRIVIGIVAAGLAVLTLAPAAARADEDRGRQDGPVYEQLAHRQRESREHRRHQREERERRLRERRWDRW